MRPTRRSAPGRRRYRRYRRSAPGCGLRRGRNRPGAHPTGVRPIHIRIKAPPGQNNPISG
ncbi:hypothetical protein GCM10027570_05120 [Streptomonospora sediminis]